MGLTPVLGQIYLFFNVFYFFYFFIKVLKGKGEYIKGGTATLPVGGSHSITSKL